MSDKKFIGIIGAGSIGCWLGGRLKAAGHEVAILREPKRISGDNEIIVLEEGEEETRVELPVWDALDPKPDLILLAVKAMYLPQVAPLLATNMKDDTLVLPLQNGVPFWFLEDTTVVDVDPVGSLRAAVPIGNVIGTVVHASVSRTGDWIRVGTADKLLLGEPSGAQSARVTELVRLFREAGVPAEQDEHIRSAIWYKLWGNLTINPLSALTRQTVDRLLDDEQLVGFIRTGMEECRRIGEAIGCPIADSVDDRLEVTRKLGVFKPSMLQDVEAGRPLEWKALVAAPRAIAREHGIDTPAIDALLGMIRQLDGAFV
ncbi:ketopantoate reductase family protein [Sphingomicrobium astaxanthinifaciens]|uniref:ketopantoate reductase family protein n=1 Tax=Sphingomicrobium astaxanthinifaciens TaxID=1227949 RepID=UPI001FCBB4BD|nr:2-dehydropantoate 2-reductase [Sphingomicrobium astaxanthinifaciens]MCJ7421432.1 2-dehydropantoate 2-reductase [Sphingomicrobium astaxanthinifaciens]